MSTGEALELGLTFAIVGMLVVFTVLGAIAVVIGLLNRWSDRVEAKAGPAATAPTAAPRPTGQIDGPTLAVIAAAATAALNRPVRVRHVQVSEQATS